MRSDVKIRTAIHCAECGERLRNWDFLAGRAHFLASGAYCMPCSPLPDRTARELSPLRETEPLPRQRM
jgi:hypothetical protein